MLPKTNLVLTSFTPSGRVNVNACSRVEKTIKSSILANSSPIHTRCPVKKEKRQSAKGFLSHLPFQPAWGFVCLLVFCRFFPFLLTLSFNDSRLLIFPQNILIYIYSRQQDIIEIVTSVAQLTFTVFPAPHIFLRLL